MTINTQQRLQFQLKHIYLIAESVMLGALNSPSIPGTVQTASLYVAMPFALMRKSG